MIKSIGIVGQGFVGSSINNYFSSTTIDVNTFDLTGDCNCKNLEELVSNSELIFLCLPTPMRKSGECDLSIIKNTIKNIRKTNKDKIIVIKSTITPGSTDKFIEQYGKNIIFNPEFLTEANAQNDFVNQDRIILGGYGIMLEKCSQFFSTYFPNAVIINCKPIEAELTKYVTNTFLAVKVAYANEIATIAELFELDYEKLVNIFTADERLGNSHWHVPGPDGKKGFGGSCFPKDINALIFFAKKNKIKVPLLENAWKRNIEIDRKEKDWELLIGRAISEEG